jgi:hypothetical protein
MNNSEPPVIFDKNGYFVLKCPYCENFSTMDLGAVSARNVDKYENHLKSCRSEKISTIIDQVIEENYELLEKLND